jgi:transposase
MSARRTDMHRLQEVIRLHRLGQSRRTIARQLRMGRDTIREYLEAFSKAGLLEGDAEALPGLKVLREAVEAAGGSPAPPRQASSVEPWRPTIEKKRLNGAGPTAIHDFLRLQEPEYRGSVSAVKRLCARLQREQGPAATDVAIPVETAPGEVAQVDFGYAGKRYDPDRGVLRKCWLFVMTLGFSRHMFADLVFDQKIATWLRLHADAFDDLTGVPRVIVPDNLKPAVVRAAFGVDDEAMLNRSYREVARHYGCQIDPTPPRSPEKKGKVEAGVKYVKRNFLATWETVDIREDRRQLRRRVKEIAGQRRHGTTGRRPWELFAEQEREALLPLPARRWELVVWKKATLHRDSHVQIDGAFYSAPWRFLHQELWVRCTPHHIAIYHRDEHLWTHPRLPRGQRSTVGHHLPDHRRDLRHRSREHWLTRARAMGREVEQLAQEIFGADDVLLKLRKVQAVVSHLETFPIERARAAARRALFFDCTDYRSIKAMLRKGLDLQPLPDTSTRAWSQGSRFARTPHGNLFSNQELNHADHR